MLHIMPIQRRIERHQLPYYLKVFNRVTDKPMGYIGNISREGLMLISPWPMLVLAEFDMRLKIPGRDGLQQYIDFSATCRWTREDVTPGSFDSGFELADPPVEYLELVEVLRQYFTFHPNAASA
ncbi:PilZ domain-containing protein [Azotobacter salinestris]